jgi:excisionase family DNA binding protein
MSSATAEKLLTAGDLAQRWQVPKAHVYRLTREGKLPAIALGRYRRYALEAVEAFEREGGTAGAETPVAAEVAG